MPIKVPLFEEYVKKDIDHNQSKLNFSGVKSD